MSKTKIQWADATINAVTGCTKVSAGCKHCYSEAMTRRLKAMGQPKYAAGFGTVVTHPEVLSQPLRWKKPRTIFWNSMGDTFHEDVPDEFIAAMFGVVAATRRHRHIVLTKRAARLPEWFRLVDSGTGRLVKMPELDGKVWAQMPGAQR